MDQNEIIKISCLKYSTIKIKNAYLFDDKTHYSYLNCSDSNITRLQSDLKDRMQAKCNNLESCTLHVKYLMGLFAETDNIGCLAVKFEWNCDLKGNF